MTEYYKIQVRKDTEANWRDINPTLEVAELACVIDLGKIKIGDGYTPFNALPYATMTVAELDKAFTNKQDKLVAGDHIKIVDTTINVVLDEYATIAYVKSELFKYALKTDIPTKVSQLDNDKGYINQVKTIAGQEIVGVGDITFPIDDTLNNSSKNAVENKVVTKEINSIKVGSQTASKDIAKLKDDVNTNANSIINLTSKTNDLVTKVDEVQADNVDIKGRMDIITSDNKTINSRLNDVELKNTQQDKELVAIKDKDFKQDTDISTLQSETERLDKATKTNTTDITNLENRTTVLEGKASQVYANYDAIVASGDHNTNKIFISKAEHTSYIYANGAYQQIGKDITIDSALSETSENPVQNKTITTTLNTKANVDGYYDEMRVGMADNITAGFDVSQEGYNMIVANGKEIEDGSAEIKDLKGSSVVYNQILKNGNFADGTNDWIKKPNNSSLNVSVENNIATIEPTTQGASGYTYLRGEVNTVKGHTYYLSAVAKNIDGANGEIVAWLQGGSVYNMQINSTEFKRYSGVFKNEVTENPNYKVLAIGLSVGGGNIGKIQATNVMLIDLTQMFGKDHEPTKEQFEAIYNQPYYEYNEGEIVNYNANGFKIVGTNLWDEQVGRAFPSVGTLNPVPVESGETYWLGVVFGDKINTTFFVIYWDENMESVGNTSLTRTHFKVPFGVKYVTFGGATNFYGQIYHHDIMFCKWTGKVPEYKPYKEDSVSFNIQDIKDKEGNVLFPNGLCSVGDIHDEIYPTYAIKRVGSINLKDLVWKVRNTNTSKLTFFESNYVPGIKKVENNGVLEKVISVKYESKSATGIYILQDSDFGNYIGVDSMGHLFVSDIQFKNDTNTSNFIEYLNSNNLIINYKLAEPIIVEFEHPLNTTFQVENQGTIYQLPEQTSTLTSTPTIANIRYYMNASGIIENLPKGYISEKTMKNFLGQLSQAMGGQWAMTYNPTSESYDFAFTASVSTQSNRIRINEDNNIKASENGDIRVTE